MNLYPAKMNKIEIFTNKKNKKKIIELLYSLKMLHLKKYKREIDFVDLSTPLDSAETSTVRYLKLTSAINNVLEKSKIKENYETVPVNTQAYFPLIEDQIENMKKIEKIKEKLIDLNNALNQAEALKKINVRKTNVFGPFKNCNVVFASSPDADVVCKKLYEECSAIVYSSKKSKCFIAVYPLNFQKQAEELLSKHNAKERNLQTMLENFSSARTNNICRIIDYFKKQKRGLEKKRAKLKQAGFDFFSKNKNKIFSLRELLKQEVEKKQSGLYFGETRNTIYISGWVPSEKIKLLEAKISTFRDIYIEVKRAEENAPVYLKHDKAVKDYDFLLGFYELPKFNTIDPTAIMAFTFPFLFGMMLGDIGYGIIVTSIALMIMKMKGAESLSKIFFMCGLSTIAFGFIFGEFFGAESIFGLMPLHVFFHRAHEINTLMLLCIGTGVVHINLGFVLSGINHLKHKNYMHFAGAVAWIMLQLSVALIYFKQIYAGAILALISIVLIYKAESISGLIEIPGLLGNILSYMRLMAVGLASVYLAVLVNEQALNLISTGLMGMIAGGLLLFAGHGFNIALGMLSPFIHTLRLHYVEFFTKFYDGGGEKYNPFGKG